MWGGHPIRLVQVWITRLVTSWELQHRSRPRVNPGEAGQGWFGLSPKIGGKFPPKSSHFVLIGFWFSIIFTIIHFLGEKKTPIFGSTPISGSFRFYKGELFENGSGKPTELNRKLPEWKLASKTWTFNYFLNRNLLCSMLEMQKCMRLIGKRVQILCPWIKLLKVHPYATLPAGIVSWVHVFKKPPVLHFWDWCPVCTIAGVGVPETNSSPKAAFFQCSTRGGRYLEFFSAGWNTDHDWRWTFLLENGYFFIAMYRKPNEPRKKPSYFPLYWMVNRDPYNGLL